jgi:monoamine oxidase
MDEFGMEVYQQYDRGKTLIVDFDNKVHEYDAQSSNPLAALPPISMAAKLELAAAILSMEKMSEVVNPESPWDDIKLPFTVSLGPKTTREADQITVQTWFNLNMLTKEAKTLLGAAIVGYTGVELGAVSFLHWLFVLKTYRRKLFNMNGEGPGQAEQYRIRGVECKNWRIDSRHNWVRPPCKLTRPSARLRRMRMESPLVRKTSLSGRAAWSSRRISQ